MNPVRHPLQLLRPFAACILAASLTSAAPAPPIEVPAKLDLPTSIGFALEHNFAIRQARERIKQQDGIVVEISARRLPGVTADAVYQLNDKTISNAVPASDQSWQINLLASQVLYAGGGVNSSIKSSKLAREAALLDLQAVINESLLLVRVNYYDVLLARERIKVQESNLELLQQQLKTATDRYEAGTVSSFEKLRAEVAVANAKVPLITARNDFRLALESLRQSLGFASGSVDTTQKVPEFEGTLDYTPQTFDLKGAFDAAKANRPDLERIAKLADSRQEAVVTARSTFYPNVSAYGGWTLRKGVANNFGDSHQGWLAGVQTQWAIFDGKATSGRVAQAKSSLEQIRLTLGEAQLAVEVEVRRAYSQWQQATELAAASVRVVEQAEESLRLANARYLAGTATQLDVLAAQVDLTTARSNQIEAYHGYNVAVAALRKAMGQADEFVTKV